MFKRIYKLALIIAATAASSAAQHAQAQGMPPPDSLRAGRVQARVILAMGSSELYGSDLDLIFAEDRSRWLPAFAFGLGVEQYLSEKVSVGHALQVSKRGGRVALTDSIYGRYQSQLNTFYLDVQPLSLGWHHGRWSLSAGPYVGALLAASIVRLRADGSSFLDRSVYGSPAASEREQLYLQKFDFGVLAGVSFRAFKGLGLELEYRHGFTDIYQFANSYIYNSPLTRPIHIYNRALHINLHYYLIP